MQRVLIVDDEPNIRELVGVYIRSAGFEVDEAADGAQGLRKAESTAYDAVVLDIMLPMMDGVEVCRRIRQRSNVPIIMLTARDSDVEKVAALETGADDYVTKPFSPPELVARVRAIIRRAQAGRPAGPIVIGGLSVDPAAREVRVDGSRVPLTTKEFDLLHALAREPGVVMSRERLLEAAWGFTDYVDARGVDVHIRHIRQKLGDEAATPRFIETIRGVGYRLLKEPD
jgi:DNA-binding response OmpR family regulator